MKDRYFELVFFDLIGTLVNEQEADGSLIIKSFIKTFELEGILIGSEEVNLYRGKSKIEAIKEILVSKNHSSDKTQILYNKFMKLLKESANKFSVIEGAFEVIKYLENKNIKVAVGSGLPVDFVNILLSNLRFTALKIDYTGSSEDLGKGRPDPIMINDAIVKLKISNKKNVLKVGDTIVDILEGKNAGVLTASVLTGTQTRHVLEKYNPDYILDSIRDIVTII